MLIAQITDIHLGFEQGNPEDANLKRLETVLARLVDGPNRPGLLLLTGDLAEHGDAESYRVLADAVSRCPFPVWPIIGNHDGREAFAGIFPLVPSNQGFVRYAFDAGDLRIVMLDTVEPGRHGGAFCEPRAAWLQAELSAHPATPTVIAMHHPPVESGLAWMDDGPGEPWVARFAGAIRGHSQIAAILCGHLHRTIVTQWSGIPLIVCPSIAPAVALNLNPVDPGRPDGRDLVVDEPPGYALHRWNGHNLVSHFESITGAETLVRFDAEFQPAIRSKMAERS